MKHKREERVIDLLRCQLVGGGERDDSANSGDAANMILLLEVHFLRVKFQDVLL